MTRDSNARVTVVESDKKNRQNTKPEFLEA